MTNAKMFLFARWISMCYADEHIDNKGLHTSDDGCNYQDLMSVLNRKDGYWWKEKLEYFNNNVFPNYVKNKSFNRAKEFLKNDKETTAEL